MVSRTIAFDDRGLLDHWKQCTGNTDNIGNNVPVLRPPETTKYLINKRVWPSSDHIFRKFFFCCGKILSTFVGRCPTGRANRTRSMGAATQGLHASAGR